MLLTEYNEAEAMELFKEDGRKEGIDQNRVESIRNLMKTLKLTAQQAADLHPDQVIVASGANDFIPPIKGHGCLLPPEHKNSGCA